MTLAALAGSYARRVQFEARVQAGEMVRALAAALDGEKAAPRGEAKVTADQLLGQMGVRF